MPLRFSVIVPTYQRRTLVLALVRSMMRQELAGNFEVIIVVDGSDDGSAHALRKLGEMEAPFQFAVLEQANQGAASARNRGAAVARGEILLFLDDDMEAHPQLLVEHDRSHRDGAQVVLGHIPLHPESPSNILSAAVKSWADDRTRSLSSSRARLTLHDLLTGQISLSREIFERVGGFDTNFTRGGSFGDEDVDFGYRLMLAGYRIVFNPNAISWQNYVVRPRQHLRQWRQAGRADVAFARKHPEQSKTLFALNGGNSRINRWVWRPLASLPFVAVSLAAALSWPVVYLVERGVQTTALARLFFQVRALEYWIGVREAGGIPRPRPLRILAYHAIQDLVGAPVVESYGVPPDLFRRQLDTLQRARFNFISADEFLHFLYDGGGLPRRPLLLTFDDGYTDLLDVVLPDLKERNIRAVVFAVSGYLGGANEWDAAIGAPRLQLLNIDGLKRLEESGMEIGGHSRTHRFLTRVPDGDLSGEITGSVEDLEAAGLNRPRLFAYPYGEQDQRVRQAARDAGLKAAFTVIGGRTRPGYDAYQVPRIEIMREDSGWKLLWKVIFSNRLASKMPSDPSPSG